MTDPERSIAKSFSVDFTKHGIKFDEHHMVVDGKYQSSPPNKLKVLYAGALPDQGPPSKVQLRGEINSLKQQHHCLGVYKLLTNSQPNGNPAWKHVSEDLILASSPNVNGGDGWVVAQFCTFTTKERRCMTLGGEAMPFETKRDPQNWQEWDGHAWIPSTVKCRASSHGWGEYGIEKQAEDDMFYERHGGSPTRARKSPPGSPTPMNQ